MPNIKVGDRVKYSARFLRSISEYTGDLPFAVGVVKEIKQLSPKTELAIVDWDNESLPKKVLTCNLATIKQIQTGEDQ